MEKHIIFISVMIDQNTKALSAIIYIYIYIYTAPSNTQQDIKSRYPIRHTFVNNIFTPIIHT